MDVQNELVVYLNRRIVGDKMWSEKNICLCLLWTTMKSINYFLTTLHIVTVAPYKDEKLVSLKFLTNPSYI